MRTIAIIGSSGTNARPWTDAFLAAGWQVRNLMRAPQTVARRPRLTTAAFDFEDRHSYAAALTGIDVLALISPANPGQVVWESGLIDAVRRASAPAIIKLSVIGADLPRPISAFACWAAQIEAALRVSGIPHIVLRANSFMQNLLRQRASIVAGRYLEPSGATAASRIDVHDLADVAVAVADGPCDGRALTLTGPAALTGAQMADVLGNVLSRPVRFISPPLPQLRAALTERGMPAWQIDALVELQEAVLAGRAPHTAVVTDDVAAATGRPQRTFAEFAQREFGG